MEELAKKMPQGFSYSWTGLSLEELAAGGNFADSVSDWARWSSISRCRRSMKASCCPSSCCSPFRWRCWERSARNGIRGLQNDVFCQVGLVMLVGLASKNAILIVEFAEQLRRARMPLVESAVQAAAIRLRPILMTSLAFILGVVPLVFATGAGENGRHSVGTTVFGGMIMSTFLNLFFIPVLYLIIEGWREHGKKPQPVELRPNSPRVRLTRR